jgi:predicted ABC-type ATPase
MGQGRRLSPVSFFLNIAECLEFVNADLIAGGLSPFAPERAAMLGGRLMLEQIHSLADRGLDFGFETTLSGRAYVKLLQDMRKSGYFIPYIFSLDYQRKTGPRTH